MAGAGVTSQPPGESHDGQFVLFGCPSGCEFQTQPEVLILERLRLPVHVTVPSVNAVRLGPSWRDVQRVVATAHSIE